MSTVFVLSSLSLYPQGAVLIERTAPEPAGFYLADDIGDKDPRYAFPRFALSNVLRASQPVAARANVWLARIEERSDSTFIIVRSLVSGETIATHFVPRGSSNLQWSAADALVYETPPTGDTAFLYIVEPMSGGLLSRTTITRQVMPSSDPGLGSCIISPIGEKIAYVRSTDVNDGVSNIPSIAVMDVRGTPRFVVAPYSDVRVDGKKQRRVLLACGPGGALGTIRHLSWNAKASLIACYGIVSYDIPDPADTTKFYRTGFQGIVVIDVVTHDIHTVWSTDNIAREHPEEFFFAPAGDVLAFSVRPGGAPTRIKLWEFATNRSTTDLGEGTFVVGPPTKEVWHLSPWTRSGGRLLIERSAGGLVSRPQCGSDEVVMDTTAARLRLETAQSTDRSTRPFSPTVTVVDPWPDLVDNAGDVRTDAWMKMSRTRIVRGCAADGASRLVLRIVVPEWMRDKVSVSLQPDNCATGVYQDAERDGSLSIAGSTVRSSQVSVRPVVQNGVGVCGVVYYAPEDYVATPSDTATTSRIIRVAVSAQEFTSFVDIEIVRPPVLLIHGIWSSAGLFNTFSPLTSAQGSDPRFTITRIDFSELCTKRLDMILGPNGSGLPVRMERAIVESYPKHVAVRADVAGHSCGPFLTRLMSASLYPTVFSKRNNRMGLVHKLISIDSPHLGSEYCALLSDALVRNPIRGALLDEVLSRFVLEGVEASDPATGGIVDDLRPTSASTVRAAFPDNLKYQPRLHTIGGVVSHEQEEANDELISLIDLVVGLDLSSNTFSSVFTGQPNDLVVSKYSEEATTLFDHDPTRVTTINGAAHSAGFDECIGVMTPASSAASRVISLLHARSNSDLFSSASVPYRTTIQQRDPVDAKEQISFPAKQDSDPHVQADSQLDIVSPLPGANVSPGSIISVVVQSTTALPLSSLYVVTADTLAIDSVGPFTLSIRVSSNAPLGPMRLVIVGSRRNGSTGKDTTSESLTETVVLTNTTATPCRSMQFGMDTMITLSAFHRAERIHVRSTFIDGIERSVERDGGTVLTVADTSVCVISDGWIRARSPGITTITAVRCAQTDTLIVRVLDFNQSPTADAGADTTLVGAGRVVLDASPSTDPENDPLTYRWWIEYAEGAGVGPIADTTAQITYVDVTALGLTIIGLAVRDNVGHADTTWKFIRNGSTTSVSVSTASSSVHVFPQPCSESVSLSGFDVPMQRATCVVHDAMGNATTLECTSNNHTSATLNTTPLASGVYYVRGANGNGVVFVVKR